MKGIQRTEVVALLKSGISKKDIAHRLGVTPSAVSYHIKAAVENGELEDWLETTRKKVLDLHDQGLKPKEIAAHLGITSAGVHYHLVAEGIHTHNNIRSDIDMNHVRSLYEQGLSVRVIADQYNYDRELLRRRMDRAGIPRRTDWRQHLPKGEDNCQYKDGKGKERHQERDRRNPRRTSWQVAAICLGHPLPREWVVHHHDENPENNDWRNLWIFRSWQAHGSYHGRLSYLRFAGIEVDATQLASEKGGLPLPPPPAPILSERDIDRPALWERLRSLQPDQTTS